MEQNKEIVDSLIISDKDPKKPSRMFRDLKETDKPYVKAPGSKYKTTKSLAVRKILEFKAM